MSQYVRLALAMEFVMSRPGDMRMMVDDVMSLEDEDVSVTHIDYIHDEAGYEMDEPRFVIKLQKTFESLNMDRMLGISDSYVKRQFYSRPELERATNSSYHDMTREIVLPRRELESVLSCVYPDIPAELTLSDKILHYYTTPVNDFADLIVKSNQVLNTVVNIVTFVGKIRQRSLATRRSAVENYFNNRANVDTYMNLLKL